MLMRVRGWWAFSVGVMLLVWVAGCSSEVGGPSEVSVPSVSATVSSDTTTVALGGGAHLIIPPGAITAGAQVTARFGDAPAADAAMNSVGSPVELTLQPDDAIHGLLTLEFPVPVDRVPAGVDPAEFFGISTYTDGAGWVPYQASFDAARSMVVAQIPHFSWWNPFTWDFSRIDQNLGQIIGSRAGEPSCDGTGTPVWARQVVGVDKDANLVVRGCTQSQGDVLDVELVNNRPYGLILTYGSAVKWGWHEEGSSASDRWRNSVVDHLLGPDQLYLPPLSRASVGILPSSSVQGLTFRVVPSRLTMAADLVAQAAGAFVESFPTGVGECAAIPLNAPVFELSLSALRDDVAALAGCAEQWARLDIAAGNRDTANLNRLGSVFGAIRGASLVAAGFQIGGVSWHVADLFGDWKRAYDINSDLGVGFTVFPRIEQSSAAPVSTPEPSAPSDPPAAPAPGSDSAAAPEPAPQAQPAQPAQPEPTVNPAPAPAPAPQPEQAPPPAQSPSPVDAYTNYGDANAGHAMCRGNPGNARSMPGGVASQTFTVPAGVSTLSSALVQIDPDPAVTAQLALSVNGQTAAAAAAAAAGDTRFTFNPVPVHPGDSVVVTVAFTATTGKIITVYTAGNPGGVFSTSNSCPDGAPSVTRTDTGLRAVISGTT